MSHFKPIITQLENERVDSSKKNKPKIINSKQTVTIEPPAEDKTPPIETVETPPKVTNLSDKVEKIKEAAGKIKRPKNNIKKSQIVELW